MILADLYLIINNYESLINKLPNIKNQAEEGFQVNYTKHVRNHTTFLQPFLRSRRKHPTFFYGAIISLA